MQNIIAMEVLSAVSEKGFSLDELVFQTRELFEKKGLAGFVGLILRLTDERLCREMVQKKTKHDRPACCSEPRYEYQGLLCRQFRTSVGTVAMRRRRLRCCNCGRTNIPLRDFLGLAPYQSKTSELEKIVTEIVSEQTYWRSSSHLSTIGSIPVPKSTAHRWVERSDCDQIDDSDETFDMLVSDGDRPIVDSTAYVDPSAQVIGNVHIGSEVYIGPNAVIRADEPDDNGDVKPVVIGSGCNIIDKEHKIHGAGGLRMKFKRADMAVIGLTPKLDFNNAVSFCNVTGCPNGMSIKSGELIQHIRLRGSI